MNALAGLDAVPPELGDQLGLVVGNDQLPFVGCIGRTHGPSLAPGPDRQPSPTGAAPPDARVHQFVSSCPPASSGDQANVPFCRDFVDTERHGGSKRSGSHPWVGQLAIRGPRPHLLAVAPEAAGSSPVAPLDWLLRYLTPTELANGLLNRNADLAGMPTSV